MANKQKIHNPYEYEYKSEYENDWDTHRQYVDEFDSYEAMLMSQVYDSVSRSIDGSKITDGYATTLARERADRVIGRLPSGQTTALAQSDVGKAALLDILRTKWVYPNANAQHPLLQKLTMWQFYSSVYGYMPMFYDWNVRPNGTASPDCWLWNPRNLIPQTGKISIDDMDYVTALTWVTKPFLQEILENPVEDDGWDREAVQYLLELAESDKDTTGDSGQDTKVARDRTPNATRRGICLATRYEAGVDGEWCTFAPDHGCTEVRKLPNPHKNGRIPFVIKYSQALFDSFYGLGDFQRAKPLQFARDGLTNFYFKGIKMNLVPPLVANANGVVKHTLDYREGGVVLETVPNSVRQLNTSMAGLSTYQAAQSNMTGSLLSLFGSQNASIPGAETLNPSQGKTPAAISLYSSKEATRDGAERRNLEMAIEKLTDGMFSVLLNVGADEVPVTLFADDINDLIKQGYKDIPEIFGELRPNYSRTAGELRIDPTKLKGVEFRFNIKADSTAELNKQAQLQSLLDMMDRLGKYQNVLQKDPTVTIHWDKIMARYQELSGIPGADEFITYDKQAAPTPEQPSPTSMKLPSGVNIESRDLIGLYQKSENPQLRRQIAKMLGFDGTGERAPEPEVTVSSSGYMFQDPQVAEASNALDKAFSQPLPVTQPAGTVGQ